MSLAKLFIFAFWCTLVFWYIVEKCAYDHVVAPTVVVTPQDGE